MIPLESIVGKGRQPAAFPLRAGCHEQCSRITRRSGRNCCRAAGRSTWIAVRATRQPDPSTCWFRQKGRKQARCWRSTAKLIPTANAFSCTPPTSPPRNGTRRICTGAQGAGLGGHSRPAIGRSWLFPTTRAALRLLRIPNRQSFSRRVPRSRRNPICGRKHACRPLPRPARSRKGKADTGGTRNNALSADLPAPPVRSTRAGSVRNPRKRPPARSGGAAGRPAART